MDISGGSDGGNEVDGDEGGIISNQIPPDLMFCILERES